MGETALCAASSDVRRTQITITHNCRVALSRMPGNYEGFMMMTSRCSITSQNREDVR